MYTPTLFVGQGFGGLPDDMRMARPFALTGQIGYAIPSKSSITSVDPDSGDTTTELNPRFLTYGGSLQYSMPYLKSNVVDLGLPEFFDPSDSDRRISIPDAGRELHGSGIGTTGTVSRGVIWIGKYFQVGLEAIIPVNRASGTGVGVLAQLHFYLDDLFPNSIGKPIFGSSADAREVSMRAGWLIGCTVTLLLVGGAAGAHAFLEQAEPRVGSTVHAVPREVTLRFTQDLEPAFSTVTITDAAGARVDAGKPNFDGNIIRVPLREIGAGSYRVTWQVLSVDTHPTEGSFSFVVEQQ